MMKIALALMFLMVPLISPSFGQTQQSSNPSRTKIALPNNVAQRSDNRAQTLESNSRLQIGVPSGRVKIIVDGNRLVITGTTRDIEIIKRAVATIQAKMKATADPQTSERIRLKFQTADVVATMLNNSLSEVTRAPVTVRPLHFPESILLVGPASSVKEAKKLLATIDSHSAFKKPKPIPSEERIY